MNNFTIITDPGIDDVIALALLNKLRSNAQHNIISSFGNVEEAIVARNAKECIALFAPQWQLRHGAKKPLQPLQYPWADYFHGPDGVWGVHQSVDTSRVKIGKNYPKNTSVISLAPMTEVCYIQEKTNIKEIVIMGGAFREKGNETEYAETNIAFDPDAAHKFFGSCEGIKVKVVPLDITRKLFWKKEKIKNIPESNVTNTWIKTLLLTWYEKYNHAREEYFNLHDPLAVLLTFFPEQANWKKSGVNVITKGEKRGMTVFDEKNPVCIIGMSLVNAEKTSQMIFDLLFTDRKI